MSKKNSTDILGYFELENGDKIEIISEATGRNMMLALQLGGSDEMAIGAHQICQLTKLNETHITPDQLNELPVEVVQAIKEIIIPDQEIKKLDNSTWELNGKKITLIETRKQRHDTEAYKLAGKGNNHEIPFWLIHLLIQIDDKPVMFDDILEMSASEVAQLLTLIAPKDSPKFVRLKN